MQRFSLWLPCGLLIYFLISIWLFNKVYHTTKLVVDEEFHLRQGLHYCDGNFTVWDPKITTFPGLYIVSTVLLLPFRLCEIYYLRLVSLLASVLNVYWIYEIRKGIYSRKYGKKFPSWLTVFEALSISILPPMYFFAFLYYTDIVSISAVLAMMNFSMKHSHRAAALSGFVALLMRQTNIVWIGAVFGLNVMDKLVIKTLKKRDKKNSNYIYTFGDILAAIDFYLRRITSVHITILPVIAQFYGYVVVMVAFIVFLWLNGSIVVGDKSAHEATLHLPQIGYFSVFTVVFGGGLILADIRDIFQKFIKRWYFLLFLSIFFTIAVTYNTIVHPYILADNRHYTFYLWNRLLSKPLIRFMAIPIYVFAVAGVAELLKTQSAGFKLIYSVCTIVSIFLQSMIEFRYFLLPFLILRLFYTKPLSINSIGVEFAFNIAVNIAAFNVFFTKTFYWSDYSEPQRIMW
ncbi:Dol-P-Glc:Glc(2)Man(9)GlcNAc(2)-PP-Dol alpha-1,2-glucosyltransferase [Sergentomyia squamirostris]